MQDMINGRCGWCGTDELYVKYHDQEWGKLVTDDKTLFEFLVLESAQAGLSWITILRKREGYRKAFCNFDAVQVAQMTDSDVERLMRFDGIVRNRLKIKSTITNARLFLSRPEADYQHLWVVERDSGIIAPIRCHEQRHEKTGIQILRQHDLLRPPAGGRIYRRSPDGLHLPKEINNA